MMLSMIRAGDAVRTPTGRLATVVRVSPSGARTRVALHGGRRVHEKTYPTRYLRRMNR